LTGTAPAIGTRADRPNFSEARQASVLMVISNRSWRDRCEPDRASSASPRVRC